MATYKKGFKKEAPEQVLLKVIVGIIITVVGIVLVAFLYDLITDPGSYNDFPAVEKYAEVLSLKDEENVAYENYVVYFYSDTCGACSEIKGDILRLANKINRSDTVFFLANTSTITDTETALTPFLTAIGETQMRTPIMVVVAGGVFEDVYVAGTEILPVLEEIEKGTFAPFNE